MDEMVKLKRGETLHRWQTAIRDQAFLPILDLPVLQTRPEHFLRVLESGKAPSGCKPGDGPESSSSFEQREGG